MTKLKNIRLLPLITKHKNASINETGWKFINKDFMSNSLWMRCLTVTHKHFILNIITTSLGFSSQIFMKEYPKGSWCHGFYFWIVFQTMDDAKSCLHIIDWLLPQKKLETTKLKQPFNRRISKLCRKELSWITKST